MSNPVVGELIDLLQLERLEENLFRGQSRDIGTKYVFGGQVLGQALSAAQQTVDPARAAESGWRRECPTRLAGGRHMTTRLHRKTAFSALVCPESGQPLRCAGDTLRAPDGAR